MYTKHTLDNGIEVVLTKIEHTRSVSMGLWIKTGSVDESESNNGISHFIEHMLFKGSKKYSAKDIAEAFDYIGGDLNAFTSKECTCFHAKVLDHHIDVPIKIIAEMISSPLLKEADIEKEKSVVLDEIMMAEDTPDDVSYDLIAKTSYGDGSLSLPILGNEDTLKSFDKNMIISQLNQYYTTDNMVISIAGSYDEVEVLTLLNQHFNMSKSKKCKPHNPNEFFVGSSYIYRDIEQVHLEIAYEGIPYGDESVFSLAAFNNILGASVSSRLFQNIREEYGLTYSINSYLTQYEQCGLFSIYASMNTKNTITVAKLIRKEIDDLITNGFSDEELQRVKEQLKGNYILDLEGSDAYMNLIGKGTLFDKRVRTADEVEDAIDQVNTDSVNKVMMKILESDASIALVGRVDEKLLNKCTEILRGQHEITS